jgi:hypothetical protein
LRQNPFVLKLPLLLAQFLYQHKKLTLPGIGIFTLIPSAIIPDEQEKTEQEFVPNVEFENAEIREADDELIEYIRANTGKIKPLAISDLDSYLTLGTQLLNIGKPFYIEGVGTLTKSKDGKFEFMPGQHDVAGFQNKRINKEDASDRQNPFEKETHQHRSQSNAGKRIVLALAIIAGLAIIIWGSYKLYERNTSPEVTNVLPPVNDTDAVKTDTEKIVAPTIDSTQIKKTPVPQQVAKTSKDSLEYKFIILATDNKYKALRRYNQLLSYQLKIKMQTKDSSFFKLYFSFPALAKDTVHIKDSLNLVYATHASIEQEKNNK